MAREDAAACGFSDVGLVCGDCGQGFVWTAGEQLFYEEKNFKAPRRCLPCREQQRAHTIAGRRRWQPAP